MTSLNRNESQPATWTVFRNDGTSTTYTNEAAAQAAADQDENAVVITPAADSGQSESEALGAIAT